MRENVYFKSMLLDFYGEMLTEKQRNCFDLYYNDDLSLSEIGENKEITRQAARDLITRAEKTLLEYEGKIGFVKRYLSICAKAEEIHAAATEIEQLNKRNYFDTRIERLAESIKTGALSLKE